MPDDHRQRSVVLLLPIFEAMLDWLRDRSHK